MRCPEGRLREELGLSSAPRPDALLALARDVGFHRAGFVDPGLLPPWAERWRHAGAPTRLESSWLLHPDEWSKTSSILVCCLSCHRRGPDDLSTPGDPHALIAPFARANYYRTAALMLRALAARCESEHGIPRRSIRIFTNSAIPEKPLLAATGLAAVGKNGLCIVRGLGSLFVIAGVVLPVPTASVLASAAPPAPDPCGGCDRCLRACPVRAFRGPGVLDPQRCLQGLATSREVFDPATSETWGARLYGCQDCQACCPHNRNLDTAAPAAQGEIGPSISLRTFLAGGDEERKSMLRGTALAMSWIPGRSLLRNALTAAGNRGDPVVRPAVASYENADDPMVRQAARRALERL